MNACPHPFGDEATDLKYVQSIGNRSVDGKLQAAVAGDQNATVIARLTVRTVASSISEDPPEPCVDHINSDRDGA